MVIGLRREHPVLELPDALPVLIVPAWDRSLVVPMLVPGHDGSVCLYVSSGEYLAGGGVEGASLYLNGVPQAVLQAKMEQFLGYPNSTWENGWYEDPVAETRWYSTMATSDPMNPYGLNTASSICRMRVQKWTAVTILKCVTRA